MTAHVGNEPALGHYPNFDCPGHAAYAKNTITGANPKHGSVFLLEDEVGRCRRAGNMSRSPGRSASGPWSYA